jgi:hypothetical protein
MLSISRLANDLVRSIKYAHGITDNTPFFRHVERSVVSIAVPCNESSFEGPYETYFTAWFIDSTHLITVEHAVSEILDEGWRYVLLMQTGQRGKRLNITIVIRARLLSLIDAGAHDERLAVIELWDPVDDTEPARVCNGDLNKDEWYYCVAYALEYKRCALGRLHPQLGNIDMSSEVAQQLRDKLPFEFWEDTDCNPSRSVVGVGGSGSPIFNTEGEVVAVVAFALMPKRSGFGRTWRVPTEWGQPNVMAVGPTQLPEIKL